MNEYISLQKIITLFEEYQQSQINIGLNGFGYGNIVDFGLNLTGGTQALYPFMFVTAQNVSYNENITTYTMSVIFGDRINDDKFNLVDVQSDMSIQAKRFMSWIRRGFNQTPNLYDNMEINLPVTGIPFLERFNDYVGGMAIDVDVIVFEDINACDYYDFDVSPTPTPTPTPTPIPFCINQLYLTNNFGSSGQDGYYDYVGSGYVNIDNTVSPQTLTLYYGTAPNSINYALYQSGSTNFVVSTFINNVLDALGPFNYFDGNETLFGNIQSTISDGYVIPQSGSSVDFTIDYLNCVTPTPTTTPTTTVTPTRTPTVTPTVTPSRTCPCLRYVIGNNQSGQNAVYRFTDCQTGQVVDRTIGGISEQVVCSQVLPVRISGAFLTIFSQGPCCVVV